MKRIYLILLVIVALALNSCRVMLSLSEFAIPLKEDEKVALLEKIQAEPDSLFVYIRNSEFYHEEYSYMNPDSEFMMRVMKSIKECKDSSYFIVSYKVGLIDGNEFGSLMEHSIFLVHDGTCLGLRLGFVRKGFRWYVWAISHIIPEYICYPFL